MRIFALIALCLALCVCCCGKKMWGARSKKDQATDKREPRATDYRKSISKAKEQPTLNLDSSIDIDGLFSKFDELLDNASQYLLSGKLTETLQTDVAQEWLDTLQSIEDPSIASILGSMNFEDHELLTQQLLTSVDQLRSQKAELRELLTNPSFLASLMNDIPIEYRTILESLLTGNLDKFKDELLKLPGVDSEMFGLLEGVFSGSTKVAKETLDSILSDQQIENTRQQLLSNPELLEMLEIPDEVLKNPILFSQFMKKSIDSLSVEDEVGTSNSRKARAI